MQARIIAYTAALAFYSAAMLMVAIDAADAVAMPIGTGG